MAAEAEVEREVRAHRNTYSLFIGLMKYGTVISVITALIVIFIISN